METTPALIAPRLTPLLLQAPVLTRVLPTPLSLGQLLKAVVLDRIVDGKTNLSIQNAKVAVQTRAPVQAGDELILRVERLTPIVHQRPSRCVECRAFN